MLMKLVQLCPQFCTFAAPDCQLCLVLIHCIKSNSDKQKNYLNDWKFSHLWQAELKRGQELQSGLKSSRAEGLPLKAGSKLVLFRIKSELITACPAALHWSRYAMSLLSWTPDHSFEMVSVLLKQSGIRKSGFEASGFAGHLPCFTLTSLSHRPSVFF